ncbi:hypothetical protein HHL11_12715 [Ramlibacter sp. G-1-2-2]|uniref:Uncharacterized protein n=1 Tax=Ramlibacter agri TaxID=2728837 RepID=A0A848H5S0_9BURK|nr:hypothetical protein [Ramlibacter agri]NML44620.1 hypothetical protein [Ramlibacter agri]
MRRQAEHRIRGAAALARPGWTWLAALLMNAPSVGGAVLVGWFAFTADEPALQALAGILFALALLWACLVTLESWRVLRRFVRRGFGGHEADR